MDTAFEDTPDFSLVLGGPLYQLFRRTRLSGPVLELLKRRIIFIVAIAWLPLLVLTMIEGHCYGTTGLVFLRDIENQVRFLIALPILIAAELLVHQRLLPVVKTLVTRNIVPSTEIETFRAALGSALRMRNSYVLEIALIVFVYTFGHWLWTDQIALGIASWYATPANSHLQLTHAGYWLAFVSVPIYQFILFRWYLRFFIWFWFLFRVSKLSLNVLPAHPDRAGGLGFLGRSSFAFSPLLFAQGVVLAGVAASKILYHGESLLAFKFIIPCYVLFLVFTVLAPLLIFTPRLAQKKREGLNRYGAFATTYVRDFDQKWLRGGATEDLLGTGDIQSLADLGNSFAVVQDMKLVVFGKQDLLQLLVAGAAPCVPLLLTIMPLEALLGQILKIVF